MSPRIPSLTAREVIRALQRAGWVVFETHGSHCQLKHPGRPGKVTVPAHPGDLPRRIVYSILAQADFLELL